jgi:hypothetical protein
MSRRGSRLDWTDWIGLDGLEWVGLDWIGLDWIGLDWIGLDWIGLVCIPVALYKSPIHSVGGGGEIILRTGYGHDPAHVFFGSRVSSFKTWQHKRPKGLVVSGKV